MYRAIVFVCCLLVVLFSNVVGEEVEEYVLKNSKHENNFISMGCWGGEKNHKTGQKEVAELMKRLTSKYDVGYSIAAGDNFYRKGIQSVDDDRWESGWADLYPEIPFLSALGNHDYRGSIWAQVNKTFTKSNKLKNSKHLRWNLPFPYYDIVMGSVHWFILDTVLLERCEVNIKGTKLWSDRCWDQYKQLEWFTEKVSKSNSKWKIVVGHYPMYANGPHVNHLWLRRLLDPLFKKHGVSMYINADNHYLQYSLHDDIYYLNAGGGAGYMKHNVKNKGFKISESNIWHHFGDGLFLHFVIDDTMFVYAVSPEGDILTNFKVKSRGPTNTIIETQDQVVKQQHQQTTNTILPSTLSERSIHTTHQSITVHYFLLIIAGVGIMLFFKRFKFLIWGKQHHN